MGLSKFRAALPKKAARPLLSIDLSAFLGLDPGEAVIRFHEPGVKDLFAVAEVREKFLADFPDFIDSPTLVGMILVLASCYIGEVGETEPAWRALGLIARDNMDAFLFIQTEFNRAFPQNVQAEVDKAKNGSTQ